jgi:CheY-like chemotaxis protein
MTKHKKISVMIVDDSEEDRYILKRTLGKIDREFEIFEVSDGAEALSFLKNHKENKAKYPDGFPPLFIFLDVNMPMVNGFEFLEKYKEVRQMDHLDISVVVMFTSSKREEDVQRAQHYEFVGGYLVKEDLSVDAIKAKLSLA